MENKKYYPSLDSIRGLASLQVLVAHCLVAIPALYFLREAETPHDFTSLIINSPIHLFWVDSQAVILFFVLSGFVLSLPHFSTSKFEFKYLAYIIKRITRLFLPCFVIITISILLRSLLYKPDVLVGFGDWVKIAWSKNLDFDLMVNTYLLHPEALNYFDRSLWSLGPEIKLSILLPLAIFLIKPLKFHWCFLIFAIYVITYHALVFLKFQNL